MKKKLCACLVAGALLLSALSGCGGAKKNAELLDPASPVTVTIWHYYNGVQQMQFDEMVSEFNDTVGLQKGIIVTANSKNSVSELSESVLQSVRGEPGADPMPNIFATYAETAWQIDQMGMLVDMSAYFSKDELDEYVPEYLEEGALGQKGQLKIFPTAKSTEVMMLNQTDWQRFADACGVTYEDLATWEGVVAVAEQYYNYTDGLTPDVPNDGRAFFGRDSVANYMVVGARQLGFPFAELDAEGKAVVSADKTTLRTLWENYYVPFVKGYFAAESRFRSDDTKTGAIIALVGSTTSATYFPTEVTVNDEYTYAIQNVVLPVPGFAGCPEYVVQQGAGMSVLKSDEKTQYACAVFLKWFTEESRNIGFAAGSGYLPVKRKVYENDMVALYGEELGLSDTIRNTFRVAIEEIKSCRLYTSPPYNASANVRSYVENTMVSTAAAARAEARDRIAAGEARADVLAELTGDAAFEGWYAAFAEGLAAAAGE